MSRHVFRALGACLLLAAAGYGVSLLHGPPAEAAGPPQMADVLIGFKKTPGPAEEALVRRHGGTVKRSFTIVPAIAARIPAAAMQGLQNNPNVTVIERDGTVHAIDHHEWKDEPINYETELNNVWGVKRIGAGDLHSVFDEDDPTTLMFLGGGVKVAVIDSGVYHPHLDLPNPGGTYFEGYDFVNDDDDPMDDNGHGTHVAGTLAAIRNGIGVVGVAPAVDLYGLKVLDAAGSGAWSNVIAAVEWCVANGIQVTNNSYGSGQHPGTLVEQAFNNSAAAGVLHVAAAGNSGNPGGNNDSVGYPARFSSVIAVAATNTNDTRPSFSSTGPDVELAAPGVLIVSTWIGDDPDPHTNFRTLSGTSMASPHVAGVAALVMAAGVTDPNEVRTILQETALDLGPTGRDNRYGFGLVQAYAAVAAVVPPPPAEPAVIVAVQADQSVYVIEEQWAVITVTVSDEKGDLIGGLDANRFETSLNDNPVFVEFGATEDGTYSGLLAIGDLPQDEYVVSVTVTDGRDENGTGTTSFAIVDDSSTDPGDPPPPQGTVTVAIDYSTSGGPNRDRHLHVTVNLKDGDGLPVGGATVAVDVYRNGGLFGSASGTTNGDGGVTFTANNAPSGTYTTTVTAVTAAGLEWDGQTPTNEHNK